jgi:hypothetical protein
MNPIILMNNKEYLDYLYGINWQAANKGWKKYYIKEMPPLGWGSMYFFEAETNQMVRFDVIHAIHKVKDPVYVTDPNEIMFVNQWAKTNPL